MLIVRCAMHESWHLHQRWHVWYNTLIITKKKWKSKNQFSSHVCNIYKTLRHLYFTILPSVLHTGRVKLTVTP